MAATSWAACRRSWVRWTCAACRSRKADCLWLRRRVRVCTRLRASCGSPLTRSASRTPVSPAWYATTARPATVVRAAATCCSARLTADCDDCTRRSAACSRSLAALYCSMSSSAWSARLASLVCASAAVLCGSAEALPTESDTPRTTARPASIGRRKESATRAVSCSSSAPTGLADGFGREESPYRGRGFTPGEGGSPAPGGFGAGDRCRTVRLPNDRLGRSVVSPLPDRNHFATLPLR